MAPMTLIVSMAMGANYSFELISIATYAPQFIGYNTLFLGSVSSEQTDTDTSLFIASIV